MLRSRLSARKPAIYLLVLLLLEAIAVVSLRWLGWYGTGNAIQLVACMLVTLTPLLIAVAILLRRRFRFGVRAFLATTTLVAVFLVFSYLPVARHRDARRVSEQLLSANATINESDDWDAIYTQFELNPLLTQAQASTDAVPQWMTPLTAATDAIPRDDAVRVIWLSTDLQCRVLAENWGRIPSLQSVSISSGVSTEGLRLLQNALPKFEHLDSVITNDVAVPPGWFASLTNIRTLWVWGEGVYRGTPFDKKHLEDIVLLPNIEMFMVLGYAFDDADAKALAKSKSIKRVVLRGTAVTEEGESDLATADRLVFRN